MQKLLDRYLNAREALDHPPASVSEIMECDEARTQLVKALGVPYGVSHDRILIAALQRIHPPQYLRGLLDKYLHAHSNSHIGAGVIRENLERALRIKKDCDHRVFVTTVCDLISKIDLRAPIGNGIDDDRAAIQALIDSKGPAVIDDYSDMKPLHVSPLTWAVAIVAFIVIWAFAIYGAYKLVLEWIL